MAYIEADKTVTINTSQPPNPNVLPPTGLDRIDRQTTSPEQYLHIQRNRFGRACVYHRHRNPRYAYRVRRSGRGGNFFCDPPDGNGTNDCNGHGTNVAEIVGATTYGVAKQVTLHAVRVTKCDGSGTGADAIAGIDWVTTTVKNARKLGAHPAVANMSLSGPSFTTLDTAVTTSIASGVTYTLSAGNTGADACTLSPPRVPTAITVGAIDPANDTRMVNVGGETSNIGPCLKLFAPGVAIQSTGNACDDSNMYKCGYRHLASSAPCCGRGGALLADLPRCKPSFRLECHSQRQQRRYHSGMGGRRRSRGRIAERDAALWIAGRRVQ